MSEPHIKTEGQLKIESVTATQSRLRTMTHWQPSKEIMRIRDAVVRKTILERRRQKRVPGSF
jgi:hypothetical protein